MMRNATLGMLALGLSLYGCSWEEPGPGMAPGVDSTAAGGGRDHAHYLRLLRDRGFDTRGVEIFPEGFMVEGDILVLKSELETPRGLPKQAQRRTSSLVSSGNAGRIRVRIRPSLAAWEPEILQALHQWNSVRSGVHLHLVTTGGDIEIASDTETDIHPYLQNLDPDKCGATGSPSAGLPSPVISVNMDHSALVNNRTNRIALVTHELGHTIGFAHTDQPSSGSWIEGTPDVVMSPPQDIYSQMNSNGCSLTDGNLTLWDRRAMLLLYPKDAPLSGMRMKDGDVREDLVFWRPSDGTWNSRYSSQNFNGGGVLTWGERGDIPMPKTDIDGDGISDLVVWHPRTGNWKIKTSSSNFTAIIQQQWGANGDVPLGGMDVDFDGKSDLVVWRWSDATFYCKLSSTGYTSAINKSLGTIGDVPVADSDMDRDGKDDLVVWRPSDGMWHFRKSSSEGTIMPPYTLTGSRQWGARGDIPVSGTDYDGDNRDETMVWRPLDNTLYTLTSGSNFSSQVNKQIGYLGDVPLSDIDINGDGRKDMSVWRRNGGYWIFRLVPSYGAEFSYQFGG